MTKRFFLDTNIFVYTFDTSSPSKARQAAQLIDAAIATGKGVVSYQVIQEFVNLALRKFAQPMNLSEVEQYIGSVFRPLLSVHSSPALFSEALHLCGKHRLSWYDSLIIAAALESRCNTLYSEDLQDGRKFGELTIKNPFV